VGKFTFTGTRERVVKPPSLGLDLKIWANLSVAVTWLISLVLTHSAVVEIANIINQATEQETRKNRKNKDN